MSRLLILFFLLFFDICAANERHLAITSLYNWRGERALAHRIEEVCRKIGWKADIWEKDESEGMYGVDYDFVIHFIPKMDLHPTAKNYLAMFHPSHHFFDDDGVLLEEYRGYDGYLLTYLPSDEDPNFRNHNSPPFMQWYPTVQDVDYVKVKPDKLIYLCCGWGKRYRSNRYKKFLELLSAKSYTCIYGDPRFGKRYKKSYKGEIPYGGDAIYQTIQKAGVYLLLHSEDHLNHGLPSGRIFEAAASSAVIISDENAFVKKYFGSSVLYIDITKKSKEIYHQVNKHMKWIKSNKQEALKLAKRSHEIFSHTFLLEDQMLRLGDFHDQIIKK